MSQDEIPPIVHALSGAVASVISNSIVYPLDLVTTRIQTQSKDVKKARRASGTPHTHEKNYDGIANAFTTIYQDEGITSLWEGVVADNISTMASTFCYHFAYNFIRDRRFETVAKARGGRKPRVLGMMEELTIGATAGVIARFVTSPASNVVTRSQTQGGSKMDIVRSIYKEKGITGFWSGMKASVILAANPSISYYLFELQKALLVPKSRRDSPKAIEIFLMSATGKAIATLLLYPVILIKARTQALRVKIGLLQLVKKILNQEGLRGMYAGAIPQVTKGFLSQGIMMLLKDRIGALIIAGYLAINKNRKVSSDPVLHFADSPKTDVNGLIAATKDRVEVAVDAAVDKVKEVANDVAEATHVNDLVQKGSEVTQSVIESAKETVNSVVGSATSQMEGVRQAGQETATKIVHSDSANYVSSLGTSARDAAGNALNSVKDSATTQANNASDLINSTKDTAQQYLSSEDKPMRAISNAVGDAKSNMKK